MSHLKKYLADKPTKVIYQEEADSTFTHNGVEYPLNPFLEQTHNLDDESIKVSLLKWILRYSKPDPIRKAKADPSVPLLITFDNGEWVVIDGLHRLAKAIDEKLETVPVKVIPKSWFKMIGPIKKVT